MRYLIVALLLLSVGCVRKEKVSKASKEEPAKVLKQSSESELVRYEDSELGIVCYRVRSQEGLSCIRKGTQVLQQEQIQQ